MLPASTAPRPSVRDHGAHFAPDGRQAVTGRVGMFMSFTTIWRTAYHHSQGPSEGPGTDGHQQQCNRQQCGVRSQQRQQQATAAVTVIDCDRCPCWPPCHEDWDDRDRHHVRDCDEDHRYCPEDSDDRDRYHLRDVMKTAGTVMGTGVSETGITPGTTETGVYRTTATATGVYRTTGTATGVYRTTATGVCHLINRKPGARLGAPQQLKKVCSRSWLCSPADREGPGRAPMSRRCGPLHSQPLPNTGPSWCGPYLPTPASARWPKVVAMIVGNAMLGRTATKGQKRPWRPFDRCVGST
jgi:hypothetical protein